MANHHLPGLKAIASPPVGLLPSKTQLSIIINTVKNAQAYIAYVYTIGTVINGPHNMVRIRSQLVNKFLQAFLAFRVGKMAVKCTHTSITKPVRIIALQLFTGQTAHADAVGLIQKLVAHITSLIIFSPAHTQQLVDLK